MNDLQPEGHVASHIGRRKFLATLGGTVIAWPLAAHAQQPEQVRRIGVLMNMAADDPQGQARVAAFRQVLQQQGRSDRNVRSRERQYAAELITLAPDVLLASGTVSVAALQKATRTVPIVFVGVADPVGAGFVDSLARPGGHTTGFMEFEYSFSGKWLELLKEVVPRLMQAGVLRDGGNPAGIAQFGAIRATASSLGLDVTPINVQDASEIERSIATFARSANGGLVVTPSAAVSVHRALIIALAARHRLPAVYAFRSDISDGGLISLGPDLVDQFRRGAGYVDRILKGEKPADLPVQAPTKYVLTLNLKTAKALGLDVPLHLQQRADEVIE
jgi:putative ABC transport system substrate-binding protein